MHFRDYYEKCFHDLFRFFSGLRRGRKKDPESDSAKLVWWGEDEKGLGYNVHFHPRTVVYES